MTSFDRRKTPLALIVTSLAIALFFLAYPNYVIRPKRPQGARELQAALFVLRFEDVAGLVCAVVALIGLVWYLQSKPGRGARIGAFAAVVVVFVCAALSRVNIYELMFHPVGAPSFQPARETKLDGDEKVLAVGFTRNKPRAYPIRSISYHHVVNDVVDAVPIAVTY